MVSCSLSHSVATTGMKGFRTHYPKIWQLAILHISRWRNLRNGRCGKNFLTFPWSRSWSPHVRGDLLAPRGKEHPYFWRRNREGSEWADLYKFLPVYYTWLTFVLSYLSMMAYSLLNLASKTLKFNCFFRSLFPYESSHIMHNFY